ncbi:DUF1311 domain-containing protein [Acinetobacter sp. ANC 4216]|uniref:lysozyme inhibitor LprI family protein n=1 Tax=unclassified Acinetobacter TaxID=196816 RepID=UPI00103D58C5|nr:MULTISPECIES: lysozyme inhibitor LprI family protein [unclassified Acinetobacter]MCT8089369.1 DUF1311 domain-containing protein [Acinetobacter sp. F_3_1]MCT8096612.1 DUF1311 domain-containing protein [Acinetobacter sp. C_3_1]MCT8101004.1 DUF1311 domain-containing protein [Acinetobacter sp. C_4_1]MCT8134681.1 DUF1311 domain-containing protein [Acinetobacter sp. T_3_1]TCB70881.1 DUF1311 domain-containing protein [Acinetobacter sp. ANC 4216]
MIVINKFLFCLILLVSLNAYAVIPEDFLYKDALKVKCKEGSPMQEDLMYCVSRDYLESDKILNINYKEKIKLMNKVKKKELLISQRVWLENRKNKCTAEYKEAEGGREAPIYLIDCYAQENHKRMKFLKNYK